MGARFDSPISSATVSTETLHLLEIPRPPRAYHPSLTPIMSPLRPHCLAKDRLCFWLPSSASLKFHGPACTQDIIVISEERLHRILDVIEASWTEKTKETYGTGLLVFHVYCDIHRIPDSSRCPIAQTLLSAFLASCAGAYSGSTLSNFTAGIRAWHILHGHAWAINQDELRALLEGAARLAPPTSKCPKRIPFDRDTLLCFLTYMDLQSPRDAAIYACIVVTFYSVSCLGEFTVPSLKKFSPLTHITPSHVSQLKDANNLEVIAFHLPKTKCSSTGEDTQCAPIPHLTDPLTWLDNHFRINAPGPKDHLFAWKHPRGLRPLTKTEVTMRIKDIVQQFNMPDLKGHSLRIGGTMHHLLKGTPFDVVKTMGRWSGDAFTLYLRRHALILAPYLQEQPDMADQLNRIAMPPVR